MPNPDDQDDLLITTADGDKSSDPRAGKSAKALTKAQQARMDKLKLLRAARKSVRNAATRKIKDLDALLKDKDTETEDLEDHLTILLQREEELIDIDGKVESLIEDEDELMVERNDAINEREPITLYKAKTTRAIRKANGQNGSTYGGSTLILGTTQQSHGIKLQPIPITKFSGDHAKWPSFWARFKVTVEDNPRFSKVEKMIHLTSFLEGEALQAVQGFPEKDSSYQEIVDLLTQRYDKTHVVINEHMGKLIDIQPVRDSSDLKALRRLLDTCEISIRCLKTLGVNTANDKVSFICPALLRCIPKDIRTDYFVKRNLGNSNNWDADDLLQFFREQVECREMAELMGGKQGLTKKFEVIPYEKPKWKNRNEYRHTGGSAASLAVQTQQTEMYCIFCEGKGHKTSDCPNFTLEQKKLAIKTSGRCTNCLKTNHNAGNCFSKFKSCRKCRLKTHNFAVCDQNESHLKTPQNTVENIKLCSSTSVVQSVKGSANIVLLQTATAVVRNPSFPKNQGIARALLDGGSQISFVREDLARKLDLPIIGKETLDVYSFGEENPTERKTNRVKLILENRLDPKQKVEIEAVEVPFICHGVPSMDSVEIETIMNKKGLQLADESGKSEGINSELQILIGGDYYWRVVTGRNERFSKDVVAIETKLGWAIQGPTGVSRNLYAGRSAATMLVNLGQKQINETLNKFWDLESLGVKEQNTKDPADDATVARFFDEVKFTGERYSVKFPWKVSKETLPDNFQIAEKRLQGLIKKFRKDPKYFLDYKRVIEDQIATGVTEIVPNEIRENQKAGTYYVPHQGVVRENVATTKLRVVFDASSHATGKPSLNECLLPGPNLNPDLLLLLLKFRKHNVVVVSDIEKAFLQVALDEGERDSVRFLWVKEKLGEIIDNEFTILRSSRVPFGVSSSPFLLGCTIKYHLQKSEGADARVIEKLNNEIYVDDFLSGGDNVDEAYEISVGSARVLKGAGMKLRKWVTNSPQLRKLWNKHSYPGELEIFENVQEEKQTKILGLNWDPNSDQFTFDLSKLVGVLSGLKRTKRHVLSFVSQIFDPIGLLAPFIIRAKILFQDLWRLENLGWDSELPDEIGLQFESWCSELLSLREIKINRHYYRDANEEIAHLELHCFCDASIKAFATAIYVRYITKTNKIETALITAKSRVAPLKEKGLTLPRLELMGCLLGAKLINYVKGTFGEELSGNYMWTDSTIALSWVTNTPKTWRPFISNRASEVQNLTKDYTWAHCPGVENPSDLPTRGVKASTLAENKLWFKGPPWLGKTIDHWPKSRPEPNLDLVANERRKLIMSVSVIKAEGIQKIVDLNRSNSLDKMLRVTAYVLRFVRSAKGLGKTTGPITADELKTAELKFVRDIQREEYRTELKSLEKGEKVHPSSKIASLSPIISEGIICLGGRLGEAVDLTYNEKHPIILGKLFRISKLLMIRSHSQVKHGGIADTTTQLRERYWLTAGRQLARTIVKDCTICKRFKAKLGEVPTAPLPSDRISENPAFSIIGVDFFGPLHIKIKGDNITQKAYVLLTTCAVSRAVHLEIVPSLSTHEFLLAFRRVIARRGVPSIVYSDNALTFKKADKELKKIWKNLNDAEIKNFFGNQGIKWKYIVERAAWYGGWWERLVRTCKNSLKKTIGKANLYYSEMETILSETEAIINSRPISYNYNDPNEPTPLCPADLLIGRRLTSLPPLTFKENVPINQKQFKIREKHREQIMQRIWRKWRHDYLMELRSAHHANPHKTNSTLFKIGDVVVIYDDNSPRQMWKLGIVKEIILGRDNKIRACIVKNSKGSEIKRSVQHLANLEILE